MRGSGGGRPRKPDGQKVHRGAPTKDTIVIDSDACVENPPAPTLDFNGTRMKVWEQLWRSPVAVLWDHADVAALTRLVILQTSRDSLLDARVLSEMRQLEDRFLLNPYARAQQRVVIEDRDDKPAASSSDNVVTPDRWKRTGT